MPPGLDTSRDGRVLRVTLNRAEKRNALTGEMCEAIVDAFESAQRDAAVGAVLIAAHGPVFCAGMDLHESLAADAAEKTAVHEALFTAGARATKPIIAAVQGPALAGGVGLVANAHIAIAAQGCTFGLTEIRIAMWPYVVFRAVKAAVGERRATELSLTGRIFGTHEALQWGLIHQVTPPFELEDRAAAVASEVANWSADAIARGLDFARRSRGLPDEEAGRLALEMRAGALASGDFQEGVRAFQEKRRARWNQ